MKVLSWNINSVRLRRRALQRLLRDHEPDVVCLQETKVRDESFPLEPLSERGYPFTAISGQPGYHGVAILSRHPLSRIRARRWCGSDDCRHVYASLPSGLEIHSVYAPAGGDVPDPELNPKFAQKLRFFDEMARWWRRRRSVEAVLVGDLNIAPLPNDVWSHEKLRRIVTHTPIEVEKLERLRAAHGFHDALRHFVPEDEKLYTWWSYRARDWKRAGRGRRLDHAWVSERLRPRVQKARVLENVRGWRLPSDHAPVLLELDAAYGAETSS